MRDSSALPDSSYPLLSGVVILFAAAVCLAVVLLWLLRKARRTAPDTLPKDQDQTKALQLLPGDGEEPVKMASFDRAFQDNLERLRRITVGRSYRYDVPWALVVGTAGSGKTMLLDSIGLKRTLAAERSVANQFKLGVGWHFFNEGLAIDVPGSIFLGDGEKTHHDRWWRRLLWQLRTVRPQRPLDAVVLVFSVEDLRTETGGGPSILALTIRDRLSELQKQTEMRLPIYLLVTKCDLLSGFEAFARELPESLWGQMVGWSNPHSIDLAFSPGWVDEAIFSIGDRIDRLAFEMFATDAGKTDTAELFVLRNELRALQSALHEFASRLFAETPYAQSPLLRGIYLTGNPGGPPPSDLLRPDRAFPCRPIFLNDLFARKVYAEKGLATPFPRAFLSKNRLTRVMQIATAAFVITATIGSSFAYAHLNATKQNQLIPLLAVLRYQVGTSSNFSGETAFQVIRAMTDLQMDPFRSIFFPQSWIGRIDRLLGESMVKSFLTVFEGLRSALESKHKQLVSAVPQTVPGCSNVGSREDHVDRVAQYQQLEEFISDLDQWNKNVAMFDRLVTPGVGKPDELKRLVLYLNPNLLPQDVDFQNNQYFQRALSRATDRTFHTFNPAGTTKALKQLSSCFFTAWFGGNAILTYTDEIKKQIGELQTGAMNFDGLESLSQTIGATSALLERPEFQWAAKEHFDPSDFPAFQNASLSSNAVDGPELTKHINKAGDEAFQTFRAALADTTSPSIGTVIEQGTGSLVLSDEVVALGAFVGKMEQQPFAAHVPEGKTPSRPLGRFINWNPEALASAGQLYRAFSGYNFGGLPAVFRSPVQNIAASRAQGNMFDLIAEAQTFRTAMTESSAQDRVFLEAKNLSTAAPVLTELLQDFSHQGVASGRAMLASIVSDQANQLLSLLDTLESNLNPYEVRDSTFQWWNGESPVSPLAYQAPTPEGVKSVIETQTATLRDLAQAAGPALDLLRVSNSLATTPTHASRVNWAGVIEDFKKLDSKKTNPISSLETYLLSGLDKVSPEGSCIDSSGAGPGDPSDLFVSVESRIRRQLVSRCRELAGDGYSKIAANFQEHLAGRFPFGDASADLYAPEADPADIVKFLEIYDRYQASATEALKAGRAFNTFQAKQLAFLGQIAAVRPLFANLLPGGTKNAVPSYDVQVQFRTNRTAEVLGDQVIDWELDVAAQSLVPGSKTDTASWHIGDPTRLSLRFAKNSPLRPVADSRIPGQLVGDRTVSFEYPDTWSIFRLIQLHKSSPFSAQAGGLSGPSTLSFYIPTAPDPSIVQDGNQTFGGQVRVYLQLAITPSGAKESLRLPEFPTQTPSNPSGPTTSAFNR